MRKLADLDPRRREARHAIVATKDGMRIVDVTNGGGCT